jgi:putative lipoic acid-binding regulatory protein
VFLPIFYFMKPWEESLREKLDQHYSWPSLYTFKFIVPTDKVNEVKRLFTKHETTEKISEKGNYTSITIHMMMPGSDAVIEVYQAVSGIEGIIAL